MPSHQNRSFRLSIFSNILDLCFRVIYEPSVIYSTTIKQAWINMMCEPSHCLYCVAWKPDVYFICLHIKDSGLSLLHLLIILGRSAIPGIPNPWATANQWAVNCLQLGCRSGRRVRIPTCVSSGRVRSHTFHLREWWVRVPTARTNEAVCVCALAGGSCGTPLPPTTGLQNRKGWGILLYPTLCRAASNHLIYDMTHCWIVIKLGLLILELILCY